jgi:hypothetical protein
VNRLEQVIAGQTFQASTNANKIARLINRAKRAVVRRRYRLRQLPRSARWTKRRHEMLKRPPTCGSERQQGVRLPLRVTARHTRRVIIEISHHAQVTTKRGNVPTKSF